MKKVQFSKMIFVVSCLLVIGTLASGIYCTLMGYDTSLFVYAIPSTSAILAADIGFYHNKSKLENVWKMCISCIILKTKSEVKLKRILSKAKYNELCEILDNNFEPFISELETKINNTHTNTLQSDAAEEVNCPGS